MSSRFKYTEPIPAFISSIEKMLEGKCVLIPQQLQDQLRNLNRKKDGRDKIALLWYWVDQRLHNKKEEKDPFSDKKPKKEVLTSTIHTNEFNSLPWSNKTTWKNKNILAELKLLKVGDSYEAGHTSKTYSIINRKNLVEHQLETNLSPIDLIESETGRDMASKANRKNLNRLKLDERLLYPLFFEVITKRLREKQEKWINAPDTKVAVENLDMKKEMSHAETFNEVSGLIYPVIKILNNKGRVFRDKYGRLHSPFTCLKSELRGLFKVDGKELVGLDMRAAQPTLLAYTTEDNKLLKDCKKDILYEKIMSKCKLDRKPAKKAYMQYAYGKNRTTRSTNKRALAVQDMFRAEYPITADYLWQQKKNQYYKEVARNLMRLESRLFIDNVYSNMCKNNMFGLTIHDGIYFLKQDKNKIVKRIQKELKNGIRKIFKADDVPVMKLDKIKSKMITTWEAVLDGKTLDID